LRTNRKEERERGCLTARRNRLPDVHIGEQATSDI
jgi:hypothetical protein